MAINIGLMLIVMVRIPYYPKNKKRTKTRRLGIDCDLLSIPFAIAIDNGSPKRGVIRNSLWLPPGAAVRSTVLIGC